MKDHHVKKFIKVYLTQRITKDLLGDPFVNKGTPVVYEGIRNWNQQTKWSMNFICEICTLMINSEKRQRRMQLDFYQYATNLFYTFKILRKQSPHIS